LASSGSGFKAAIFEVVVAQLEINRAHKKNLKIEGIWIIFFII
jgi:hypothetical protein